VDLPFEHILTLLKTEPGSGLAQTVLLLLIWLNSRGLKKELVLLKEALTRLEIGHEVRIVNLENENKHIDQRLTLIEKN
jgi:hypothetical protein